MAITSSRSALIPSDTENETMCKVDELAKKNVLNKIVKPGLMYACLWIAFGNQTLPEKKPDCGRYPEYQGTISFGNVWDVNGKLILHALLKVVHNVTNTNTIVLDIWYRNDVHWVSISMCFIIPFDESSNPADSHRMS